MDTNKNLNKDIPDFIWVEKISRLLDNKFAIPGTNYKFGLDPIIGLIPIVGDLSTMVVSFMLLKIVAKHGGSRKLILLMSLNILVDTIFGSIPIIGSIFDFGFKANTKNVKLLKEYYQEGKHQGSGTGIIAILVIVIISFIALSIFLFYKLISFIIGLF